MKNKCLECSEPFNGRIDKKFCSDYCRNSFNNKINKDSKNLIRNINNRLRKNHHLLSSINPSGKTKVTRTKLLDGILISIISLQFTLQKQGIPIIIYMMKVI